MSDLLLTLMAVILISLASCQVEGDSWQRDYKRLIDTTSQNQIKLIQDSLDSICLENYEGQLIHFSDSIKEARLLEIQKLLRRDD